MTEASTSIDTLLRHQDWVRALARSLVADSARADDIAQQTMLEAVTRAPRELREPKGWLARVARNAARALQRQERRRTRREQVVAAAAAEANAPDPALTVQRAAAHKRVVDALFAVPEPYHTVLLLRYFEDVDAASIGRRLHRPVATVRTQLQRGLERMRQHLDGEFGGDRAAWCTALLPLQTTSQAAIGVPVMTTIGAMLMTKWILLVATAIAVSLLLQWQFATVPAPHQPSASDRSAMSAVSPDEPRQPQVVREAVDIPNPTTPDQPPTRDRSTGLHGRLVAVNGAPLAGVTIAWQDPTLPRLRGSVLVDGNTSVDLAQPGLQELLATADGQAMFAANYGPRAAVVLAMLRGEPIERERALSDGLGQFALPGRSDADLDHLVLEHDELLLYGTGRLPKEAATVFVAGPAVTVTGRVHDQHNAAIADAYVHLGFQLDALPGIAARLRGGDSYRSWHAQSDGEGRFVLGTVPAHAALQVTVQKRGYRQVALVTSEIHGPLDCTLLPAPVTQRPELRGIVHHFDGSPAAGARVDFGQDGAVCGDDGRFAFELTTSSLTAPLTAWLPGRQPCVIEGLGQRLRDDPAAGNHLNLQLGAPALTIRGRVLAADGSPFAGLRVVAVGSTFLGSSDQLLEDLVGDQRNVTTDAAGRFELRGLAARDYRVRAIDPRTLLVLESAPVRAGAREVELREAEQAFHAHLKGQLVDRFGQPVVGAEVSLSATLLQGSHMSKSLPRRDGVRSGADGRFVIERCPRREVHLVVAGDGLQWTRVDVPDQPDQPQPMRIEVVRRLRFLLRPLGGVVAKTFEVQDEHGDVLHTTEHRPGVESTHSRVPIRGEPPVYEVDDRAARIVWFDGDREVLAQPLVLRVGDVVEIAY